MQRIGKLIRERVKSELTYQTESSSLRPYNKPYPVGQAVFMINETQLVRKIPKLQYSFKRPYVVVKKFSDLYYATKVDQQGILN